jgi:hypothetical protein
MVTGTKDRGEPALVRLGETAEEKKHQTLNGELQVVGEKRARYRGTLSPQDSVAGREISLDELLEAREHLPATEIEFARLQRAVAQAKVEADRARESAREELSARFTAKKRALVQQLHSALLEAAPINVALMDLEMAEQEACGAHIEGWAWPSLTVAFIKEWFERISGTSPIFHAWSAEPADPEKERLWAEMLKYDRVEDQLEFRKLHGL